MKSILVSTLLLITANLFAQQKTVIMPDGNANTIQMALPDMQGKYLYTADATKCVMWDEAAGKQLFTFQSISARDVTGMTVSPDGNTLAIFRDGAFNLFNTVTGIEIPSNFDNEEHHFEDGVFTDNDHMLIADYLAVATVDIKNKLIGKAAKNPTELNSGRKKKIYLLPGNQLLVATGERVCIFNMDTWQLMVNVPLDPYKTTEFGPLFAERITYLPKQQVIIGLTSSKDVPFYDIRTGKMLRNVPSDEYDPVVIPSVNTNEVFISDLYQPNGKKTPLILYNTDNLLNPKLPLKVVAKYDRAMGGYFNGLNKKVWFRDQKELTEYATDTKTRTRTLKGIIVDWGWFESKKMDYYGALGKMNINTNEHNVKTIDLNRMVATKHAFIKEDATALAITTSGDTVAIFDYHTITVRNVKTNKTLRPVTLVGTVDFTDAACFFFSSDGKFVYYAVDGKDKKLLYLYRMNVASGIAQLMFSVRGFADISFNAEKTLMIGMDYTFEYRFATIWDLRTGLKLFSKDVKDDIKSFIELSADEKKFKLTSNGFFWVYNMATKQPIISNKAVATATFAEQNMENGNFISRANGGITAFDASGKELYQLNVNVDNVGAIFFSPDRKEFFSIMGDRTLKAYEFATGRYLGVLYLLKNSNDYVFMDAEGRFDGTPDGIKNLYFVVNRRLLAIAQFFERYYTPNLYPRLVNNETFAPLPNEALTPAPRVKISYAQVVRNLNVVDDKIPTFNNTTGVAEITVNASAENDKVDEIRLFQNGKIVNLATRGLFVTNNTTGTDSKVYTINLQPGVNSIRAIALNSQRTESEPDEISVRFNSANAPANTPGPANNNLNSVNASIDKNATLHLIVVGINKYQNPKMSLNYALADATAFKDEAERDARTMTANLKTYFITDDKANKDGILQAFKTVKDNAKANDVLIFYYAGHGVISEKNKEFYLVPNDVTDLSNVDAALEAHGIPSKLLQQYAIDILAQKQLFILDACQSAGAFATLLAHDAEQQKSLAVVARSTGTHWIAASGSQQFANEFSQLGHGAFTYVLLQALKGSAKNNNMVTVNGLKNFLQVQVPDLMKKYNGTAQYPASYGFGNDFPVEVIKQ